MAFMAVGERLEVTVLDPAEDTAWVLVEVVDVDEVIGAVEEGLEVEAGGTSRTNMTPKVRTGRQSKNGEFTTGSLGVGEEG